MRILQINSADSGGGAAVVTQSLHNEYLREGHDAHLLVARKKTNLPNVHQVCSNRNILGKPKLNYLHHLQRVTGLQGFFSSYLRKWAEQNLGGWDIIHCHNLHGTGYASFRDLENFFPDTPMVITLHDIWLCTGHCVHPQECIKFHSGCGKCPDLQRWVPICVDQTRLNADRKKRFLARRQPTLVGVSEWVTEQVENSHLDYPCRTIYNGVDIQKFHPIPQREARQKLGLPSDCHLLLYVVAGGLKRGQNNDYKRPQQVLDTCRILKKQMGAEALRLVTVGGKGVIPQDMSDIVIQSGNIDTGIEHYYAAADVTLHASSADTFGLVLAESLASGTPAVTTNIGGCPEVVEDGVSGYAVPFDNPQTMADAVRRILTDSSKNMRNAARKRATELFSLSTMVENYLAIYNTINNS